MFKHFTTSGWNVSNGRMYVTLHEPPRAYNWIHLLVHSWTLITSSFSQKDVGHLLFNGISYYFTVPSILMALGNTGFLALYLGAGLVASLSSLWWHSSVKKQPKFSSLGASGASPGLSFPRESFR
jgi:membrane associated rhomboid family serine protease